jgi:hypothetical protein
MVAHLKRFCLTFHLLKNKEVIAPKVFHNTHGMFFKILPRFSSIVKVQQKHRQRQETTKTKKASC